jgi:hypothetical protein
MRKSIRGLATLGIAVMYGTASFAATLSPVAGDVMINQGQGFQKVGGQLEANVGDSVMVGPKGHATIAYSDGCNFNVQPGAVFTVSALSPCTSGSFAQEESPRLSPGLVVGGLVVVGGVTALIILASKKSSSSPAPAPASP